MRKLHAFESVSVDGFFVDASGEMGWAHRGADDTEWLEFVHGNAQGNGVLIFGRVTYEMMASYWPTPMAATSDPVLAEQMNLRHKVVFSNTLEGATWANTRLVNADLVAEITTMKELPGDDMIILGSGSVVSQLAQEGLIDEYQIVVCPVALGSGRTMFEGMAQKIDLVLTRSRTFKNGRVVLWYESAS